MTHACARTSAGSGARGGRAPDDSGWTDLYRRENLVVHTVGVTLQNSNHGTVTRPHLLRHAVNSCQHLLSRRGPRSGYDSAGTGCAQIVMSEAFLPELPMAMGPQYFSTLRMPRPSGTRWRMFNRPTWRHDTWNRGPIGMMPTQVPGSRLRSYLDWWARRLRREQRPRLSQHVLIGFNHGRPLSWRRLIDCLHHCSDTGCVTDGTSPGKAAPWLCTCEIKRENSGSTAATASSFA